MGYPPTQIVDDNDRPIGGADLFEAFDKGLIHRVVFIFVEDETGRLLLQKRSPHVYTYPDRWDISSAGGVDEGEDYETAARRELNEELGIDGAELTELDYYRGDELFNGKLLKRFKRVYRVKIPHNTKFKLDSNEVSEVKWFTIQEVETLIKNHPDKVATGLTINFTRQYSSAYDNN